MNYHLETSAGEASVRYELSSSQALVVQARAGEQYRVVSSHGELPDNVVAIRTDTDLEVRLDNGINLIIEDYYVVCRNNFCGISLSEEGVPLSANEEADKPFSGDNMIVYSHGSLQGIVLLDLLGAGFVHEPQDQTTQLDPSKVDDTTDDIPTGEGGSISALGMMSLAGAGLGLIAASASSEGDSPAPRSNREAPVFTSGSGEAVVEVSVNEGETAVYTAEATDADGGILFYSLSGPDAALFTIDANTGEVSFIDAPDFESLGSNHTYDIIVIARRSDGFSASQNVTISVSDVNEGPAFTSDTTAIVDENQTAAYTAEVTDPDGDTLTYTYSLSGTDTALFTIGANTGEVTFIDAPDYEALGSNHPYEITITATDSEDLSTSQNVTISVSDVNEGPIFTSGTTTIVDENQTVAYTAVVRDTDGDALTYTYRLDGTDAALFNIDENTGVVSFRNAPDYENPGDADSNNVYDITVTATDSDSLDVSQNVTISVSNVNDPVFTSGSTATVDENQTAAYTAEAGVPGGVILTYSLGGTDAALFNLDANSGELTFKEAPDYENLGSNHPYNITITATGSNGLSSSQDVTISVSNVNERVELSADQLHANELGFAINGLDGVDYGSRTVVSSAGDFNGDGLDDLIIGAPSSPLGAPLPPGSDQDAPAVFAAGAVYVVYGRADGRTVELSDIAINNDNSLGIAINGMVTRRLFGGDVSHGDVNGDGFDDIVIGTDPIASPSPTDTYVVYGGSQLSNVDISDIENGRNDLGFMVTSSLSTDPAHRFGHHAAGWAVSAEGDINGDGFDDVYIGTNGNNDMYVVYGGSDLSNIETNQIVNWDADGIVIHGESSNGRESKIVGDVNGDGIDDMIFSEPWVPRVVGDPIDSPRAGYVVFGVRDFTGLDFDDVKADEIAAGKGGFVIHGLRNLYDHRDGRYEVDSAGDVNGDGFDDLIISDREANNPDSTESGVSYVIFGGSSLHLSPVKLADIEQGIGGFAIRGAGVNDWSGYQVSTAGDINGDGLADLLVGTFHQSKEHGNSYVVFGKTDTDTVELADVERGIGGFVIAATETHDARILSLNDAGDLNGDGFDDILAYTFVPDFSGVAAYVVYGGENVNANAIVGTSDSETLVGSSDADQIIGGRGDDTLMGNGGADVLRGGAGNDILAISDTSFALLDGGNGKDTLRFDTAMALDLTELSDNRITDVEAIDLRNDGGNSSLTLGLSDVLNLSDSSTSSDTLRIYGSDGDEVIFIERGANQWVSENGSNTWEYRFGDDVLASVLIDSDVDVSTSTPL
ncbi:hypothetical protein FKG94_28135 [Exilibacterium tricleocarpae]|uniref:Cadherin domain-containing protein n=1 Tax=Exilibacterium tricleocarpae TaxID=2591008 RepID=A0A545SLP3_9GAMM|nr:cadherin domain-containing protein [Exilibacterium tricleocarpae]TQV65756.1 hypothetical protein FKG94_28135 [Exilibacterium tricleocarpae]